MSDKKERHTMKLIQGGLDEEHYDKAFEEISETLHQQLDDMLSEMRQRDMFPYIFHWMAMGQDDLITSYSYAEAVMSPHEAKVALIGALEMAKHYAVADYEEPQE